MPRTEVELHRWLRARRDGASSDWCSGPATFSRCGLCFPWWPAVGLALTGCQRLLWPRKQPPQQTTLVFHRVELPAVFINGCPFVDLKVNGQGPYRFLVDTGSGITSLTPVVEREVRLAAALRPITIIGSGGANETQRPSTASAPRGTAGAAPAADRARRGAT